MIIRRWWWWWGEGREGLDNGDLFIAPRATEKEFIFFVVSSRGKIFHPPSSESWVISCGLPADGLR